MIVPLEVQGKLVSAVIDTGAQVTIINSQFYDTLNLSLPLDPVLLKGINPEKSVKGYLVWEVPLTLGVRHTNGTCMWLQLKTNVARA